MDLLKLIIVHIAVVFGLASMVLYIYHLIMENNNRGIRNKRILALVAGLLIYILSSSIGKDYISTIFESYISIGLRSQFLKAIASLIMGYLVTQFFYKKLKEKDEHQNKSMLIIFSTLIFFTFIDLYLGSNWTDIEKSNIVSNAFFVLGLILSFLFGKYNISEDELDILKKESKRESESENNNTDIPDL